MSKFLSSVECQNSALLEGEVERQRENLHMTGTTEGLEESVSA